MHAKALAKPVHAKFHLEILTVVHAAGLRREEFMELQQEIGH